MLPVKKVLCTTDFSEGSYEGMDAASELADRFGAELLVVYVANPIPDFPGNLSPSAAGFSIESYRQEWVQHSEKELSRLVRERFGKNANVRPVVRAGPVAERILETCREEKADIVVIASHGRTGLSRVLLGSVAEKVVRMSPCPVLVIPADPERKKGHAG